ncbi:MAG TPA: branched-chain amino acid ABC transporter substrate-binding protein [Coriobacteriia bacterium]
MGKARKYMAIVALLAAVALVVTGCGSTAGTPAATGATKVTIGIGAPLTDGAVALGKGMVRGANLAIEQANATQEVKDLKLTIASVEGDDKGDPTTGGNVATQFASNPTLVGVMGHLNSGVTRVAVKIYNAANIVQVSPANTAVDLTQMGMKNYFRVCANDAVQGPAGADYAFKTAGKKKAFVVDDSTPYGVGLADEWSKQFIADGGAVAGREKTSDKDTDFKSLVTKIKAAGPDIVYYGGIYNSGALLSKQLKEGGVNVPLMGGDGLFDPAYIKLAGAANAKGDLATSVGLPTDQMPKGQEFIAAYKVKYPSDEIAAYDAYSYDAANAIIKAIISVAKSMGADKVATTAGKQAIIAAVAKTNFEGVSGTVSFDANGDTTNKAITTYIVGADGAWAPAAK